MPNCDITVALEKGALHFLKVHFTMQILHWVGEAYFKKSKMEFNHDMLLTKNA